MTWGMQVQAPSRDTAQQALRARSQELIRTGDLRAAERVESDRVLLAEAPGDNLYEMHRLATERYQSIRFPTGEWLDHPELVIPGGLGALVGGSVAVAGLSSGNMVAAGIGLGILGGIGIGYLVCSHRMKQHGKALETIQAVERNQSFIRGFVPAPAPPTLNIDRKAFLSALAGQEVRLAEGGDYARAGQMRKVHGALEKLPGANVDELFQNLLASQNREILDLVQGSCSGPIADTIQVLAEVGKLVSPDAVSAIREEPDTIVIGGVVLRKSARAA